MSFTLRAPFAASLAFMTTITSAQLPTVDITFDRDAAGDIEVYVRPDAFFDGVFSSLVFSMRWLEADGISLGDVSQSVPPLVYCSIAKSGPEAVDGPYRYQVFAGFGAVALSNLGTSWAAGEEVLLCTIDVPGTAGTFEMVNDGWTQGANGNYFVSLNGENRTGVIYTFTTVLDPGNTAAGQLSAWPNPTNGPLHVQGVVDGNVDLELSDAAGRVVLRERRQVVGGTVGRPLDLAGLAAGSYVLRVADGLGPVTRTILVSKEE